MLIGRTKTKAKGNRGVDWMKREGITPRRHNTQGQDHNKNRKSCARRGDKRNRSRGLGEAGEHDDAMGEGGVCS